MKYDIVIIPNPLVNIVPTRMPMLSLYGRSPIVAIKIVMTNEEIRRREAGKLLFFHIRAYHLMIVRRKRRWAASLKIQTFYRMRFVKNSSFINAL